ncbi:MAG: MBL fold metallo-hydrolase, partial [Alphaproteobacteria bacterium]
MGNGLYAWLQPDGGWGWSNAGLIADSGETLLVDTLFDMALTQDMLRAMADAESAAATIQTIVNTHSNGDHCNGNGCCPKAEIIASIASAAEMDHESPEMMAALLEQADNLGDLGAYFAHCFGTFDFAGVERRNPTRTFSGQLDLKVGNKDVHLIEVGPAHTQGDVLVHVPAEKAVYTGDILFIEGTPIMWTGPVSNWINACDQMLALDIDV